MTAITDAASATAPQRADPSDRVKHVLAKHLCVTTAEVPDDLSSLDLDSLDQVEIGIALEDEFDIQEISDDDMTNVRSVGEWTDLIVRKLAAKAAA